jgi:hypothetical protein
MKYGCGHVEPFKGMFFDFCCPETVRAAQSFEAHEYLQVFEAQLPWTSGNVILFGKPILQPRLFCYMADDISQGYSYSGAKMVVEPWHKDVLPLKVLLFSPAQHFRARSGQLSHVHWSITHRLVIGHALFQLGLDGHNLHRTPP